MAYADITVPPTLTPPPVSTTKNITCDPGFGMPGSVVKTTDDNGNELPQPFPPNTQSVTLEFNNLSNGKYRLAIKAGLAWTDLSYNTRDCISTDVTNHTLKCKINQIGEIKFYDTSLFQLQKADPNGVFPGCGIGGNCTANDGYHDSNANYSSCAWSGQTFSGCNLVLDYIEPDPNAVNPINADQVQLIFSGSGIPPFIGLTTQEYGVVIQKGSSQIRNHAVSYRFKQNTEINPPMLSDRWYERENTYTASLYYAPCGAPGGKCLMPENECRSASIYVPKKGQPHSTPQIGNSPNTPVSMSAINALDICRPLCQQIHDNNLKQACSSSNDWKPDIPCLQLPIWKNSLIDQACARKAYEFVDNMRRSNNENLEVLKCIACFRSGGIHSAIGCIPAQPGPLIDWFYQIFLPIAGGIMFLGFLYVGFSIIISGGDPKKLEELKNLLTSLIVGFLLLLFSIFIFGFITGNVLALPGFNFRL